MSSDERAVEARLAALAFRPESGVRRESLPKGVKAVGASGRDQARRRIGPSMNLASLEEQRCVGSARHERDERVTDGSTMRGSCHESVTPSRFGARHFRHESVTAEPRA